MVTGSYTLSFREAAQVPESAGAKGALLGRLAAAGFRVPAGFVLSGSAYQDFRRAAGIDRAIRRFGERYDDPFRESALFELDRIRLACLRTPLPETVRSAIMSALAQCGIFGIPLAIRPSVSCEEETEADFERMHQAALNVLGFDAVDSAVRGCWAGLWLPRAVAYRRRAGIDDRAVSMPVIVQRLVPADAAGLALTRDPANGEDVVEVRSAWGLGESVTSGRSEPDVFRFRPEGERLAIVGSEPGSKLQIVRPAAVGGIAWQSTSPEQRRRPSLTPEQAAAIAETSRRIEQALGAPQAIEWARLGDDISLLQTRPLRRSGAGEPAARDPLAASAGAPPWGRSVWSASSLAAELPTVPTPLTWSFARLLSEQVLHRVLGRCAAEAPGGAPLLGRRGGRPHLDVAALQWLAWEELGIAPGITARLLGSDESGLAAEDLPAHGGWQALRQGWRRLRFSMACRHASSRAKPLLLLAARWLGDLDRRNPRSLVDLDLLDASVANADVALSYLPEVLRVSCRSGAALLRLEEILARRLAPDYSPALLGDVLARVGSTVGLRAAGLLRRLAEQAADEPQAREALERLRSPDRTVRSGRLQPAEAGHHERAQDASASWEAALAGTRSGQALHRFLRRFGHHSLVDTEVAEPRWAEAPRYPLRVAASYLSGEAPAPPDTRQRSRMAWAKVKRHLGPWERYRCRRLIGSVLRGTRVQETARTLLARQVALERGFCLEAGARLVRRNAIEAAEDAFYLNASEVRAFLMGEDPKGDTRAVVARRKRELACESGAAMAREGDADAVEAGAGGLTVYPVEGRAGGVAAIDLDGGEPGGPGVLAGLGVSGGRAAGRARILHSPEEGWDLQPDDIVVAARVETAWAPLLLRAGGLVLESGGLLSQGALLARECGLPAVSGIRGALTLIPEGTRLSVDGTLGEVEVL